VLRVNIFRFRRRDLKELRIEVTRVFVQEVTLPRLDVDVETICAVIDLPRESISRNVFKEVWRILQKPQSLEGLEAPPGKRHAVPIMAIGSGRHSFPIQV
jgi:hypothetical protein